jgi:hypothetical protein
MAVNQKTELTVVPYRATNIPSPTDTEGLVRYLIREVHSLQATLQSLVNAAPQATDAAPLNPQNGMIRYAEGAWAASLAGVGLYVYKAGVWTHIV